MILQLDCLSDRLFIKKSIRWTSIECRIIYVCNVAGRRRRYCKARHALVRRIVIHHEDDDESRSVTRQTSGISSGDRCFTVYSLFVYVLFVLLLLSVCASSRGNIYNNNMVNMYTCGFRIDRWGKRIRSAGTSWKVLVVGMRSARPPSWPMPFSRKANRQCWWLMAKLVIYCIYNHITGLFSKPPCASLHTSLYFTVGMSKVLLLYMCYIYINTVYTCIYVCILGIYTQQI